MKPLIKLMLLLLVLLYWGCNNDSENLDPNILTLSHSGWGEVVCSDCHGLPVVNHDSNYTIPGCSDCHGANGACTVPGISWHPKKSCAYNCHGITHVFTEMADCNKCHFAPGTVDCLMK